VREFIATVRGSAIPTTSPIAARYSVAAGCAGAQSLRNGSIPVNVQPLAPDTTEFFVAHVIVGPGPNFPGGTMNDVVIAYGTDFDVPSDTGSDNRGFVDETEQTVYQQGQYSGSPDLNDQRYAGMAYRGKDEATELADGGFVWDNERYIYPREGYDVDTLELYLPGYTGWEVLVSDTNPITDLNSVIVVDNNATIGAKDNLEFCIVFWSVNPNESETEQDYTVILDKAEKFICGNVPGFDEAPYCPQEGTICDLPPNQRCVPGDADGNEVLNVSDIVYLIQFVFGTGNPPTPFALCSGDADVNCVVNVSDIVYMIQFVFGTGSAPGTCQQYLANGCDPTGGN
jgi:hypothetical protein